MSGTAPWSELPTEMWIEIFSHLKIVSLNRASRVCNAWRRIALNPNILRSLCERNIYYGFSVGDMFVQLPQVPDFRYLRKCWENKREMRLIMTASRTQIELAQM